MRASLRLGVILLVLLMNTACGAADTPTLTPSPSPTRALATTPAADTPPAPQLSPTDPVAVTSPEPPTSTAPPAATPTPEPSPTETVEASLNVSQLPDPAGYSWSQVTAGLASPVGIANPGDDSGRLFILEQEGRIRILQDGELIPGPFLDIRDRIICCGERGLLGIAFHPDYTQNGYFYINYNEPRGSDMYTIIARFQVSSDPDVADPASELRLLEQRQPYNNHNGGGLEFGPDGFLYIGLGDGGSAGDPQGNAQSLDTWLGKLLRVDVDTGEPYAVPADNPFTQGGGLPENWAYGLRNPWRFSFDALTGDLYIGDVGQGSWEEIDFLPAVHPGGANFGWNYFEGAHPYEGSPPADLDLITPVAEYSHSLGFSVTGGYVYRGSSLPDWYGVYLYGDYGSGNIWGLLRRDDGSWENSLLFQTGFSITSFGLDEAGELYLVDYGGRIYRLDAIQ